MASRGSLRAATQNAYRGVAGSTRQAAVHVTLPSGEVASVQVYTAVDVVADPELGQRLLSDDPGRALNVVRTSDGGSMIVTTPVVYHDAGNELMVLVLAEHDRHRELLERAHLLTEMASDPTTAVPRYARDFQVVFGARGLRVFLEDKADKAVAAARAVETEKELERERGSSERRRAEVTAQAVELQRVRDEMERRSKELERRAAELDLARADLDRTKTELELLRADVERMRGELQRRPPTAKPVPAPAPAPAAAAAVPDEHPTGPFDLHDQDEIVTANQTALDVHDERSESKGVGTPAALPTGRGWNPRGIDDEATVIGPPIELPAGSDPLLAQSSDVPMLPGLDAWLGAFATGNGISAIAAEDQGVRLALRAPPSLARGPLDVRLQLHRTPHYPVVTITVATPQALRGGEDQKVVATLDVAADGDKKALAALGKKFALTIDLVADGRRLRRVKLVAPLEENAAYVARAAHEHLRTLAAESTAGAAPSLARARQLLGDPGYDFLGAQHPEASEFRDDKLGQLGTANQVRRALAIARRFTRPSREDYLVTVRGYALSRWQERRRQVLSRAVEWGLWMGPELAQAAVSEGMARSRKDLVARLETAFGALLADAAANDLDGDAAEDNRKALAEEAKSLGISTGNGNGAARTVASQDAPAASGTIEKPASTRAETKGRSVEELLALLDDRQHRVAAALELCERGDPRAVRPVINSVRRMGRAEAVRVLGASVKFGEAAAPALTAGLGSSKGFLRHGCALALGMLRTEAGTEAVIDLMLSEPTEIWRELARAVGQIGPQALMPLAARMGRLADRATPGARERVAWAMAHIGVRGGRSAVETLSTGASVVAPVALQALDLMAPAARDDLRGTGPGREVTVNRAFSRKFFEALGQGGLTAAATAELEALDASSPMELLDEADLIDVNGDAGEDEELDESDLMDA